MNAIAPSKEADMRTAEQLTAAYLLDLTEKRIAAAERQLPCSACTVCQFTTCAKAGAFRYRERLLGGASAGRQL
jgi:hypothetical protein